MIFHHPLPIEADPQVGSSTHVTRMLRGFEAAGYEIEIVAGSSRERVGAMKKLRREIARGRRFDFAFAEASTAPTSLNDPSHLPLRPIADWRFFRFLRRQGVPVGLFYPDVHWRFPFYAAVVPVLKRIVAKSFYWYDLAWYHDVVDALFMPSSFMRLSVPTWRSSARVVGLAPGGDMDPLPLQQRAGQLHLFYVGSVTAPLYDITDLVRAVNDVPGVFLTISCPAGEREIASGMVNERITLVHEHGDALRERYWECDIACLVYTAEPYRVFAMPVKMFEAIGFGRPVLTGPGTSASAFIEASGMGWVVEPSHLSTKLAALAADASLVRQRYETVIAEQDKHSWMSRAEFVAGSLMNTPDARPPCVTEPPAG